MFELRERKAGVDAYGVCSGGLGFNPSRAPFAEGLSDQNECLRSCVLLDPPLHFLAKIYVLPSPIFGA